MKRTFAVCGIIGAVGLCTHAQNIKTVMADTNGVIHGNAALEARVASGGGVVLTNEVAALSNRVVVVESDVQRLSDYNATNRISSIEYGGRIIDATGGVWQVSQAYVTNWWFSDSRLGYSRLMPDLTYPLPDNYYAEFDMQYGGEPTIASFGWVTDETYQWYTMTSIPALPGGEGFSGSGTTDPFAGFSIEYVSLNGALQTAALFTVSSPYGLATNHVGTLALQSAVDLKADKSTTITIGGVTGNLSSNNTFTFNSTLAPIFASDTNVVVASTDGVYSITVTGAGPVGIDWSALALDGTSRAEVTLRLNVSDWGGTNVTFAPSLMFDATPEILVTGLWEFAASTIDGVTTLVHQTWPESTAWHLSRYTTYGGYDVVGTWSQIDSTGETNLNFYCGQSDDLLLARCSIAWPANGIVGTAWVMPMTVGNQAFDPEAAVSTFVQDYSVGGTTSTFLAVLSGGYFGVWWAGSSNVRLFYTKQTNRLLNSNERAAYAAGWRP